METESVPAPLRQRLGPEATMGLLDVFEQARAEWTDDVMTLSVERFERRLAEEGAGLRVALAHSEATLRIDIATIRADLIKWSFVFWITQMLTTLTLVGYALKR